MLRDNSISKVVKKMQQGGLTVFAPEPNQYRTPIPGIDPSIYRFNPAASFDMSPLIEMQKQEQAAEIQRQNAALAREKMMHQTIMQERKLAAESEKELLNLMSDNYSKSGGQATDRDGNLLYSGDDIRTSKRFAPIFQEVEAKKMELFDQIAQVKSLPYNTPNRVNVLARLVEEYKRLQTSTPATAEMEADSRVYHSVMKAYSDPSGKMRVNRKLASNYFSNRAAYFNNAEGSDRLYKLGQVPPGLLYDYEVGKKAFEDAILKLNSPHVVSEQIDTSGNIIKTNTQSKIMDTETAANTLAELVLAQPDLRAYVQDTYGISLYSDSPNDPLASDDKKVIADLLKPIIAHDDATQIFSATSSKYMGQMPKAGGGDDDDDGSSSRKSSYDLNGYYSRYYNSDGVKISDPPMSELQSAARALTNASASTVYGKDQKANETRTKLDLVSMSFLQAGGNINDPQQMQLLQNTYAKVISANDTGYVFSGDEKTDFERQIDELSGTLKNRAATNQVLNVLQLGASGASKNMSASELAKKTK